MSISGTVSHFGSNGHFGFIKPDGAPDGSKNVHFLTREIPAEAKRLGARVQFDLATPQPAEGPHAINVKLIEAQATAPAPHQDPVPMPEASPPTATHKPADKPAPVATVSKLADFEVIEPKGPRPNGNFLVRVLTRQKGKPKKKVQFVVFPPRACKITTLTGRELDEEEHDHEWMVFNTNGYGIAELLIAFEGSQMTIEFRCKETTATIDLVKPRYMLQAVSKGA